MEKIAWVTGGSAGIGAETCRRLVAEGHRVFSLARRKAEVAGVESVEVDLADAAATLQAATELAARCPAATLVHNAGAIREKPVEDVTADDLNTLANLHIGAAIALLQANLPAMKKAGYGRVVLMSTRAIVLGQAHGLFGHQGGLGRHGPHLGAGTRSPRHHRQRRGAGTHRRNGDVRRGDPP